MCGRGRAVGGSDSEEDDADDSSSNYSPGQEEARAKWFYQVCTHHPPTPRGEGPVTWEDSEAQKREWDKALSEFGYSRTR